MQFIRSYYQNHYFSKRNKTKLTFGIPIKLKKFEEISIYYTHESKNKSIIPYLKTLLERFVPASKIQLIVPDFQKEQLNFWGFPKEEFLTSYNFQKNMLIIDLNPEDLILKYLYSRMEQAFILTIVNENKSFDHSNMVIKLKSNEEKDQLESIFSQFFI
ncbi:MAG: hypothetical protein Kow00108_08720 [Calditrichia bacterium]